MAKYIDISQLEDWLKGQLEKVQDGADPFSAGKEMAYKEVLKYLVEKKQKNARQRLAEWSQTPEGRASYERVAEEMRAKMNDPQGLDEAWHKLYDAIHELDFYRSFEIEWKDYCERMKGSGSPTYHDLAMWFYEVGAKWMAGQFQRVEGKLVDWYETNGVDYCCGISTDEAVEVPEGFYIRKK